MNIGFDLDKVFINHPPFVPSWLINRLYRGKINDSLSYRIPGAFEQFVRKLSHLPFLRQPIQKNIQIIIAMKKNPNQKFFLISSRYSFLAHETKSLIERTGLKKIFTNMYFNFDNDQPHLFKDKIITKKHIDKYIDDDLPLLKYLAEKHPKTIFFWLNDNIQKRLQKNVYAITSLVSVFQKI